MLINLINLGYKLEEVLKMIKSHPQIVGLTIDNINCKIDGIISLGY